jgi:hypothetical protein
MTLPANIRVNVGSSFPAVVKGAGVIAVAKQNGIWTIGLNFAGLAKNPVIVDPANTYTLVWNAVTNIFALVPISAVSSSKVVKILNGAGAFASPYAALPGDDVLIVKQGAANPFTVTVNWAGRSKPLTVVAGDTVANFANITITPTAGQSQMGTVNFSYVIDSSGGNITLTPLPDASGAY